MVLLQWRGTDPAPEATGCSLAPFPFGVAAQKNSPLKRLRGKPVGGGSTVEGLVEVDGENSAKENKTRLSKCSVCLLLLVHFWWLAQFLKDMHAIVAAN